MGQAGKRNILLTLFSWLILIMSEAEKRIPAVEPGGKETNLGVHRAFQSVVRNLS